MISEKYQCIFIHIPKCAGQSIEDLFLNLHGLTRESREALLLKYNSDPKKGPPRLAHLEWREYVKYGYMTEEQFHSYFKFSFVRNPYDRMFSFYKYYGFQEIFSFDHFITRHLPEKLWKEEHWFVKPQVDFIFDRNGEQKVDFIGRLEQISDDFKVVATKLNLGDVEVPHSNQSKKNTGVKYRTQLLLRYPKLASRILTYQKNPKTKLADHMTNAAKDVIDDLYYSEFEQLGYKTELA